MMKLILYFTLLILLLDAVILQKVIFISSRWFSSEGNCYIYFSLL